MLALHQVFSNSPILGVEYTLEDEQQTPQQVLIPKVDEDIDLIEDDVDDSHAIAAYYIEGNTQESGSINDHVTFDKSIGLAIETLQEGVTLEQLWRV